MSTSTSIRPTLRTSVQSAPSGSAGVHLTRRGRVFVLLVLVAVVFAAFSLGRANTQAADVAESGAAAPAITQITVQPGESLWAVARRIAPQHDPRVMVAQLRRLNDLTGSQLQVGQQLLLPSAA